MTDHDRTTNATGKQRTKLGRTPKPDTEQRKENGGNLDLSALQRTPGFMIRVLQIQIFENFFSHFAPVGFSPVEHSSLITIRDNPSMTQSELAAVLRIQLPNLVKVLSKLEADGLIKRARSLRDKRSVELSLTAVGRKETERSAKLAAVFNDQCLSPLSGTEKSHFMEMLQRLTSISSG